MLIASRLKLAHVLLRSVSSSIASSLCAVLLLLLMLLAHILLSNQGCGVWSCVGGLLVVLLGGFMVAVFMIVVRMQLM